MDTCSSTEYADSPTYYIAIKDDTTCAPSDYYDEYYGYCTTTYTPSISPQPNVKLPAHQIRNAFEFEIYKNIKSKHSMFKENIYRNITFKRQM